MTDKMNGAESLVHTLIKSGVDTCFANPGTSEMHFVAALDRIPGIRCVPGMQENVVTGMADGYGRIAGRPAATLLHCGPGLANGIANLHNARKARTPIVNIVGDQADLSRRLRSAAGHGYVGGGPQLFPLGGCGGAAGSCGPQGGGSRCRVPRRTRQVATLVLPSDAS